MRLVDTSAWIEFLTGSPTGRSVAAQMPARDRWLVPTIVQLELVKWLNREVGEEAADDALAYTQTCVVEPLDTAIAVAAAEICAELKLPTADAVVYATATVHAADILTCDRHFEGLPRVQFIPKIGG